METLHNEEGENGKDKSIDKDMFDLKQHLKACHKFCLYDLDKDRDNHTFCSETIFSTRGDDTCNQSEG